MKFLERLNLRRLATVAAISGIVFFGGNAVVNAADVIDNGMWAFREAYISQARNTRVFTQDLTLISTNFHLDMDSTAQVLQDGSFIMGGQLNWTYTNLKKNYSTNNTIPFYIEQIGNEMTLYVQRRNKWNKMTLPGLPAGIALIWKSTDPSILEENLKAVKAVEILNDTPEQRIMKVILDGAKLADILEKNSSATFANLSGDALTEQKEIFGRWLTAFRSNDLTFTWTVNKKNWETITAVFDLTPIMRAYCICVLDEAAAGKIILTDEERDLLDAIGYYSELRSYTSRIDPKKNALITLPANLSKASENDDALNDIFIEMTSVVKR